MIECGNVESNDAMRFCDRFSNFFWGSCGMQQVEGHGVAIEAGSVRVPRVRHHQVPYPHLHR